MLPGGVGQLLDTGRAAKHLKSLLLTQDDMRQVQDTLASIKGRYWGRLKIAQHCTLSGLCQKPGHFYTVTASGAMGPCLMREGRATGDVSVDDVGEMMVQVDAGRGKNHPSVRDLSTDSRDRKNIADTPRSEMFLG